MLTASSVWHLDHSSDYIVDFFDSPLLKYRPTWYLIAYGKLVFFPLLDYGPSGAHCNIQKCVCDQCSENAMEQ